jgi:hypothetical protein
LPQGTAVGAPHVMLEPQVDGPMYPFVPLQLGAPHMLPCETCSHAPAAVQLPVFPQVDAAHWLAGTGGWPWVMVPQVPVVPPVSAFVHASQVPLQALSQQTAFTQKVLAHSPPLAHAWPVAAGPHVWLPVQLPLWQSLFWAHCTQLPLPSQTLFPPHLVSAARSLILQVPPLHLTDVQLLVFWQSPSTTQPTQFPLPSHF